MCSRRSGAGRATWTDRGYFGCLQFVSAVTVEHHRHQCLLYTSIAATAVSTYCCWAESRTSSWYGCSTHRHSIVYKYVNICIEYEIYRKYIQCKIMLPPRNPVLADNGLKCCYDSPISSWHIARVSFPRHSLIYVRRICFFSHQNCPHHLYRHRYSPTKRACQNLEPEKCEYRRMLL